MTRRSSSIEADLLRLHQLGSGEWQEFNAMPTIATLPTDTAHLAQLGIADCSCLTRFGVKGGAAADWLFSQGVPVPDRPNTWLPLPEGGLVVRLGLSEFLIEDSLQSNWSLHLMQACESPPARVYPVLRQDLALMLCGAAVPDLLRQTCSVNFQALNLNDRPVILTSMIGVAVTVIPTDSHYRIWCDGTYGHYVWRTLVEIAEELGGGAVGFQACR